MDLGSVREVSCLESGGGESGRRKCLINQSRITRAPFRGPHSEKGASSMTRRLERERLV